MKLSHFNWKCADGHAHVVIRAEFDATDIAAAAGVADHKLQHINVHSPGGVARKPSVIRSRIISGKLADYAVKEVLKQEVASKGLALTVAEYDEIRTDNWVSPDEFDLRVNNATKQWMVEVRSS